MSVFAYDPEAVKTWSTSVVKYLNGETDSFSAVLKQFGEQLSILVEPNVWTGAAASKNYKNFLDTHSAMVAFSNSFGEAFEIAINKINKSVADLEIANLGTDTSVSSKFGTLTFNDLTKLSETNIAKDIVRYDYAKIISIGTQLKTIKSTLDTIYSNLKSKIGELNNGTSIWDGDAAEKAKEELLSTLTTNMKKVNDNLDICISNISKAAEAAQMADSGN